ncbi:MAG: tetratricopeptide repeat protein, partial [Bacteroidales bacterium]|nr:tetratricopeptide repeat protein [Bacteroidales bacterium]
AYHVLGVLYGREIGNIEASLQCFEKAETCNFEKTAAYYKDLGVAYGISGNYAKSIPVLEKAIELDPDDDLSYTNLGYTYMNLGDTQKGQEYIAKGESLKQKKAENDKE